MMTWIAANIDLSVALFLGLSILIGATANKIMR